VFFDPLPAFGRSVDEGGPAKPSPAEILQYGPTGFHALENAYDQNAIGVLSPKSHTNSYRMLSTWESMRFNFGYKRLMYNIANASYLAFDTASAGGSRAANFGRKAPGGDIIVAVWV
jgi:hypothetical protein